MQGILYTGFFMKKEKAGNAGRFCLTDVFQDLSA